MAGNADFDVDQGEDWTAQLVLTDFYDQPLPVTNPIRMDIKSPFGGVVATLVYDGQTPPPGAISAVIFNKETGMIQLHMDNAVTNSLSPGVYSYDLFATFDDNTGTPQVQRVVFGSIYVNGRVTATL